MIEFTHIRDSVNVGDMASVPALYFPFPAHEITNYSHEHLKDVLVIGGGTMTNWLRQVDPEARIKIGWGIGSSRHGESDPWPDPEGLDLLGIREWSAEREADETWAPCVSCMSVLLWSDFPITRQAVKFMNFSPSIQSRYPMGADNLPVMGNDQSLKDTIEFLASAEIIVTNSYHGAYWGTLLKRRVVCVPYSSKFHHFRHPPVMSYRRGEDWHELAEQAVVYDNALNECVAASGIFYHRVMELLS